jgi:Ser/Thr protein kinase RdoA (MazF antagonist)
VFSLFILQMAENPKRKAAMTTDTEHPFQTLTPGFIMDAVESRGYVCDCRTLTLNSYENRVYQVGIEEREPLIAKFYRPGRWSDEQIAEEHRFCLELAEHELPVVAPLVKEGGESLFHFQGFRFALYPRKGGHAPDLDSPAHLLILGRLLGRIHAIGATRPFAHRPTLDSQSFGRESVALISERFIPAEYKANYDALTKDALDAIDEIMGRDALRLIRVHGDFHAGNILWRDDAPHLVDLDDSRMAPAVQDLWMMLSGDRLRQTILLCEILEGYSEFFDFNPRELRLIESLRTLRILHFTAWLARRWGDPTFPHHFPWFNTPRYWGEHILQLREQIAALSEPPLEI